MAQLATLSEADLWELGWGYRAPRVHKLVAQLQARGGEQWLAALPAAEDEARKQLNACRTRFGLARRRKRAATKTTRTTTTTKKKRKTKRRDKTKAAANVSAPHRHRKRKRSLGPAVPSDNILAPDLVEAV